MTPVLKAMVEAMAAEIVRQTDDQIYRGDDPKMVEIGLYAAEYGNGENNGQIDLEKVARAALAPVGEAAFRAGFSAGEDYMTDNLKDERAKAAWEIHRKDFGL